MTDFSINGWVQPTGAFSPVDPAFQWDFSSMQSPKVVVNHYNDLLQRAADFYAHLETSYDSISASGSDTSYRSTPERRVSSATNVLAQVRSSIPAKLERRREQNRSSQRAYRERKERHQKELEEQIAQWQQKHQNLSRSYSQQTEEITRLKAQIEQLNGEISNLQVDIPTLCGSLCHSPQEFDLVPFFSTEALSPMTTPRPSHAVPSRRGS
ncbi:hypothetical protein LTR67_006495 [Exophiala xenobiotica]|nr:hypothetical protein LTR40_008668 [Exophiala xenobiotica]KAK5360624.1 hypothetical protein LTS13_010187 [Exophiala xenobiotica]KAK5403925.1 hypothetical protein LTR79_000680 [Exophiala xenobiotica]KAK5423414.1 hypothetical protein LTR90_002434 [Exophiala xenobiotica]KAK5438391.1 hypothetical protein LTR18_008913 [Exophiala xenobiotica]